MTRDTWLHKLTDTIRPWYAEHGRPVPEKVRISIGFPSTGRRGTRIGECWDAKASIDSHYQIWITPTLKTEMDVAGVLVHELVHAAVGLDAKHGPRFSNLALKLGLEGKMRSTVVGEKLRARLTDALAYVGPMPHGALNVGLTPYKKQSTRMLKVACIEDGYTVRMTRKWLDAMGPPKCPCGSLMEEQ